MKKYRLKNLDCASCAAKIEDIVSRLGEVRFVNVSFANSTITIDTDDIDEVKKKIREIEPEVELVQEENEKTNELISTGELDENKWTLCRVYYNFGYPERG